MQNAYPRNKILTILLVFLAFVFSNFASANVIDFDIGDVPHVDYPNEQTDGFHYFYQDDPDSGAKWSWVERYFSEETLLPGIDSKWVLPELTGPIATAHLFSTTIDYFYPGPRGTYTYFDFRLIPGYQATLDLEASWFGFGDTRFSIQEIYGMPGLNASPLVVTNTAENTSVATPLGGWLYWYWSESPLGDAMPTHLHLVFYPFGAEPNPDPNSVPEPATYSMLLAGLGIMGALARRRRKSGRC